MREIVLWSYSDIKSEYTAFVDDKNYEWLNKFRWHAVRAPHTIYTRTYIDKKQIKMHQLILPSVDPDFTADHINGNGLDNREENLRLAFGSQQTQNSRRTECKSGYTGVTYVKKVRKYLTRITYSGLTFHVGYFPTAEQAAKAYNEAAIRYYGKYAKLNIID